MPQIQILSYYLDAFALIVIMTRSKNAEKTNDVVEMGHDSNDVIAIDTVKSNISTFFRCFSTTRNDSN